MQAPLKLDIQRFAGLLTITFTYTSTASGYESGSKNFIGVNNCSSLKSWIANTLGASNLITGAIDGNGYGSATQLFQNCSSLTSLDLSSFNTKNVTDMGGMFYNCSSLTSLDVSNFDTSKTTIMNNMFRNCSSLTSLNVSNFDTSNVTSMYYMFRDCSSLTSLDLSNFDTSNITDMGGIFQNCSSLTELNISSFDTSKVTIMNNMFRNCSSLTSLNVSNFDISNATSIYYMFQNCSSLTSLDVSSFNTSKVTDMGGMFQNCSSLTSLDVSGWNTSNVTVMNNIFRNCSSLISLDISNFDISNVTSMYYMFYNCNLLTKLDVSNFNTENVTDMGGVFYNCSSLTELDVSNWNTSNVTNMDSMFYNCSKITKLDISSFNMSNVTNMSYMFNRCSSLVTIYCNDDWSTAEQTVDSTEMFYYCTSLIGAIKYDNEKINIDYANPAIGYFTKILRIFFNNTRLKNFYFNNTKLKQIYFNNKLVFIAEAEKITFTVRFGDETMGIEDENLACTYTAEEGMTWAEFVNSDYNINNAFSLSNGNLRYTSNNILYGHISSSDMSNVVIEDEIWFETPGQRVITTDTEVVSPTDPDDNSNTTVVVNPCFVAGTKIYTVNGLENIENIKVNDDIYSYNLDTNIVELDKVINTYKRITNKILELLLENNTIIKVTPEHKFYIPETKTWVSAEDLAMGDSFLTADNEKIKIQKITEQYEENIVVYNLHVENNNNYFVSEDKILVHNYY